MKTAIKGFWIIIIPLISSFWGCQDDSLKLKEIPDGVYTGTFLRDAVWLDNEPVANITITFSSNKWSGTSDIIKYPALCNGSYSMQEDKVVFQNNCAWTAEFDWSLILSGEYEIKSISDSYIEFHRDYRSSTSDTYVDIYKLNRQSE
ncbi:MAG: hypothetical protein KF687_11690 [Cyclobacteriaceae bacterium]|nr:hypothetical protein [Cyclobacteriaceae bacterium]